MRYIKTLSLLLIITTAFNLSSTAQRWVFIGDKIASYGPDRDVLYVRGNDVYRQVKLRVTDAPLHIVDMKIHFENDEVMDVAIKNNFRQGMESRVIDLPGTARRIKKVEFLYETIGSAKGKARIALWGKR